MRITFLALAISYNNPLRAVEDRRSCAELLTAYRNLANDPTAHPNIARVDGVAARARTLGHDTHLVAMIALVHAAQLQCSHDNRGDGTSSKRARMQEGEEESAGRLMTTDITDLKG